MVVVAPHQVGCRSIARCVLEPVCRRGSDESIELSCRRVDPSFDLVGDSFEQPMYLKSEQIHTPECEDWKEVARAASLVLNPSMTPLSVVRDQSSEASIFTKQPRLDSGAYTIPT